MTPRTSSARTSTEVSGSIREVLGIGVEFAPSVNHHVERDLLDSVVTRTY